MNKKGLTIVELIVSIGLLSILITFILNLYVVVRTNFNRSTNMKNYELSKGLLVSTVNSDAQTYGLNKVTENGSTLTFHFNGKGSIGAFNKTLKYSSSKIMYECESTCDSQIKLTNFTKTLPSNYEFKGFQVNTLNDTIKVIIKVHDEGENKNKTINLFVNKSEAEPFSSVNFLVHFNNMIKGKPINPNIPIEISSPAGATCTNTLAYDGTDDNNLRYVGKNPCNYVKFNDELWRIVGVMKNIDNGSGQKESRIKIIRDDSLGIYCWDTSDQTVNNGHGINEWPQADIKNELNGDYLNVNLNQNTYWYYAENNTKTEVFDYTKRLKSTAQSQIEDAKWNLGGIFWSTDGLITPDMYTKERGTETYTDHFPCNDGFCPRSTEWVGKVALLYPSDYGYATAGGQTMTRADCLSLSTYNWRNTECGDNDWLKPSTGIGAYKLLSPAINSQIFAVSSDGAVSAHGGWGQEGTFPVVYLKSIIKVTGGSGSYQNPYTIGM